MKNKINSFFKKAIIVFKINILIFASYTSSVNAAVPVFVDTFDVSNETTTPGQLVFNSDGTKMFLTGYNDKEVHEYALSTAYDVSTASITTSFSVAAKEIALNAVNFNPDGTKMFIVGSHNDKIHQYSLSTGFDLTSTVTFVKSSAAVTAQEGNPEVILFNDTIKNNISYAQPEKSMDQIKDAAKAANALEFIENTPDGFETVVGERGVKLSGGQRQRIALARAIIKNAPILVLDEATSALDSEVEAAIQEALRTVMEGKTVFAIAHRLSTISHMDRIVVMEEGRIVEIGTHHSLISKNGVYAGFWRRQSGGFLGVDTAA